MTIQPAQLKYRGVAYTPAAARTPAPQIEIYRGVKFTPVAAEHRVINVAECYRGIAFTTAI
ncbi:MAG: hypothetical protein AAGF24_02675 [Cyanobacteria bacterium P01_H01_bin.121]